MGALMRKPLVLHEQNSVPGLANKALARVASRVFTAFPDVLPQARWIGNPLREPFLRQPPPGERLAGRCGPLRLLVVGGSLGAKALNEIVPQALALIPVQQRPIVTHQSGAKQIDALRANYQAAGVQATCVPFIDDMAAAYAEADLVICRAGATTVSELAAVGAAALLVPFPHAVDDHQSANARFLSGKDAGWLIQQQDLSAPRLAELLSNTERATLVRIGQNAKKMQKTEAVAEIVAACEELAR